jgi:TonB-linked SusC/RagA family outer membrane protein
MRQFTVIGAFLLFSVISYSQSFNISGKILDVNNNPIIGANVIVLQSNKGSITDFDGNFTISNVNVGDVLQCSYLGYVSENVVIDNDEFLQITLIEDSQSLDEVIVIGYGTQKKKEVTGSVSVISNEMIEEINPTRIEQALQGQVSGVNITSQSGAPGSDLNIRIRGISTNGDNRPLILVDGNVIEDLSVINPSDIDNISVLKDATAGIYGVRAANGVILITTKSGSKNSELKFDYNAYGGFQQTTRKLNALDATQYALLVNEAHAANGEPLVFPDVSILGRGTDWQDEVMGNAPIFSNDLTVRGGGEKSTYALGLSLLTQNGIVGGGKSNFTRYNTRLNYSTEILDRFNFKAGLTYFGTSRHKLSESAIGSVLFNALNMAPNLTVRDESGAYTIAEGLGNEVINPVAQIENTYDITDVDKISGNAGLRVDLIDNLYAESNIQFNYAEVKGKQFFPSVFYGSGKVFNKDRSEVVETKDTYKDYTFDAYLNYENTFFEDHHINLTIGTSVFKTEGEFSGMKGFDIEDNSFNNASIDMANDVVNLYPNRNPTFDSRLLSYFGRVQYDFKGKYLLSAVLRRDGSSKFGSENRFGYFPSGSVGWIISEENFMSDITVINFLKFRASYGILGNDRIGDFRYVSLLNGEGAYVIGDELVIGTATGNISNPEIKWEEQETIDFGLDARLLNNKITLGLDYFYRRTNDLLLIPEVSVVTGSTAPGAEAPFVNAGDVKNSGFELELGYRQRMSDNFSFGINFNMTTLDNEVLKVDNSIGYTSGGTFGIGQSDVARMEVGLPMGHFNGLKTNGIFQNQEEIDAHPSQLPLGAEAQPGDFRYVDINNDGIIDENDKTYIGDPIPDLTMGLNISMEYKSFDFQMYLFSSIGNEIVRNYERKLALTNRTEYDLNRWVGEGSTNSHPRVTTGANSNAVFSDYFVEDGSFLRAQNLQIGYSVSENTLEKLGFDKLRFYTSVNNLFTLTKYRGFDPTVSTEDPVGGGFDIGFYPSPRTYLLGVNLKF